MGGRPAPGGLAVCAVVALGLWAATVAAVPATAAPGAAEAADLDEVVERILELPYDPAYTPIGIDDAFGDEDYPAAFPVTDTTTGICCTGPVLDQPPLADLAPPFPRFPDTFELIELRSFDQTPLHAFVSIEEGAPGVVVMHGFNTNGKYSAVRYAAFLRANGYSVIAPDHRDMGREWERGGSWWPDGDRRGQSIGWKEAEDLLVAAGELRERGAPSVGVLGFSEGAQNTLLALGRDLDGWIDTALTFSGPADQRTQMHREEAATAALLTTVVDEPDACTYLAGVGEYEEFSATPNFMLRQASAIDTLDGRIGTGIDVPGLHVYARDDVLVPDYHATMLASRTLDHPLQHTLLVEAGNHAYLYDRWWTQAAALAWFGAWLDPDGEHTDAEPTVTPSPIGRPFGEQTIDLSDTTREDGDAERREADVCEPHEEPVGPNALLLADGDGPDQRFDARRSYSGWDHHDLDGWVLDPGDGTTPHEGDDILTALVEHRYTDPGTYEATLTVTDDAGNTDTAIHTVEVAGDAGEPAGTDPPAADEPDDRDDLDEPLQGEPGTDEDTTPELPATGGGLALLGVLALLLALHRRRPEGPEDPSSSVR